MVFTPTFENGFVSAPFDPAVAYLQEERSMRLTRVQGEDGQIGYEFPLRPRVIAHLQADAVPLNLLAPNNYFHFLIEGLPTILSLVRKEALNERSVVVSGQLHPNMSYAMKYALRKVDPAHIELRVHQAVTCDRVVTAPPSGYAEELLNGRVTNYTFDAENIRHLRIAFEDLWAKPSATPLKLFIRRQTPLRRLANTEALEALAIAAGYDVVDPGQLSFPQQVALFSSATHVIGPTGAWCANLVFMREDAVVTVLYPETARADLCAWNTLGSAFNLRVRDIYGSISEEHTYMPIHSDFVVPEDEFRSLLAA